MIRKATKDDIKSLANLHKLLLGDSIFVKLGAPFLEEFYYTLLTEDDLAFAYIYEVEGRPVGFIAMAVSHEAFYAQIRKRAPLLAWSLLRSIMKSPLTIASMMQAIGFIIKKNDLIQCDAGGELLQIAVHPDYRSRGTDGKPTKFFERTNASVARELFLAAMRELEGLSVADFRIMTGDDNVASNPFYAKMGCGKVAAGIKVFGHPTTIYRGNVKETLGLFHNTGV